MPNNVRDKTVKKNWENLSFHSFHAPFFSRFKETLLSLLRIGRWTFFDQWRVMPKEYRQIPMFGSKFFAVWFLVFQVILPVQTSMSQSNHLAKCRKFPNQMDQWKRWTNSSQGKQSIARTPQWAEDQAFCMDMSLIEVITLLSSSQVYNQVS